MLTKNPFSRSRHRINIKRYIIDARPPRRYPPLAYIYTHNTRHTTHIPDAVVAPLLARCIASSAAAATTARIRIHARALASIVGAGITDNCSDPQNGAPYVYIAERAAHITRFETLTCCIVEAGGIYLAGISDNDDDDDGGGQMNGMKRVQCRLSLSLWTIREREREGEDLTESERAKGLLLLLLEAGELEGIKRGFRLL